MIIYSKKTNILYKYINNQKISILKANEAFKNPKEYHLVLKKILTLASVSNNYKESIKKRLKGLYSLDYMELPDEI